MNKGFKSALQLLHAPRTAFMLKAAIDLKIFTNISKLNGKAKATDIAKECNASVRGTEILCNALVAMGLLSRSGKPPVYENTEEANLYWNENSSQYQGYALQFQLDEQTLSKWYNLSKTIKDGGYNSNVMTDNFNPVWLKFAKGMSSIMLPTAQKMAEIGDPDATKKLKILDVAASHGMFGLSFAIRNKNAVIVAQDWEEVLEIAKENAKKLKLENQFSTLPGDFFKVQLSENDFDIILLPNFLHQFGFNDNVKILSKCFKSLKSGGIVIITDREIDEDGMGHPASVMFRLAMFAH